MTPAIFSVLPPEAAGPAWLPLPARSFQRALPALPAWPARPDPFRDDRGYATVLSAGIIAAVVALALVVAAVVGRLADSHRAQVAADLAAVAGATALHTGGDACTAAHETAQLNRAEVADCRITGSDVTVIATAGRGEAAAKAGPI
ncbi:Rv3654c family TadE-like protein [Corynebacterium urinipleomorphum]|uniref:Rv3654c family TadE-like protein n=1 Tax=Corynebacterium urinipleomorphum TaxID=1852380 RepID=UPI002E275ED6